MKTLVLRALFLPAFFAWIFFVPLWTVANWIAYRWLDYSSGAIWKFLGVEAYEYRTLGQEIDRGEWI